jgi:Mg2+ and Co2+ transporter CorA
LFSFLTHDDAIINTEVARASNDLAEATRRDGSSMKTIAVLTMAFLPATFFAAFFSIPSLGWDSPDKFVIYWIVTIPVTLGSFLGWIVVTQRQSVVRTIAELRKHV